MKNETKTKIKFSDFPGEKLAEWRELVREYEAGDIAHCRAVSAPSEWHDAILERLASMTLALTPVDPSPVSRVSGGKLEVEHPDLLIVGDVGKPPKVDECRSLIENLSLAPLSAPRRLGVIMAADKMLAGAANSLLKLAEEPPKRACVLFMLEGGKLLPTLRSRARLSVLSAQIEVVPLEPPKNNADWVSWLQSARGSSGAKGAKRNALSPAEYFAGWTAWALAKNDFISAAKYDRLRVIAESKNLSSPMLCDLALLTLRENMPLDCFLS